MIDRVDADRTGHTRGVPRVGGILLVVSYVSSFLILFPAGLSAGMLVEGAIPFAARLLPAVIVIFATGLLDDVFGLNPWQKLVGQVLAAGTAYCAGVHVTGFGGHVFADWWSLPLTVFWLVLCTNAVNLIDGVDGLAAGVGLFAAATILLAGLLQNSFELAVATMPLVGCLLGFLRYNFNPATIFLGDSGSLLLGFLLGVYGVLWSQKSATLLGMIAPLMALSVPLLDTALAVVRRFLRHKSIFAADRDHIHHRLLNRGLTHRKVALIFYALCAIAAIFSLCVASRRLEGLVIIMFCASAWIGVRYLGYAELGIAGRMFLEGAFRRFLSTQIALKQYQQQLGTAVSPEQCWKVIECAALEFGFQRVHLELCGQIFDYRGEGDRSRSWEIWLPLSDSDSIVLAAPLGESGLGVIGTFANMLQHTLSSKLPTFAVEFGAAAPAGAMVRATGD